MANTSRRFKDRGGQMFIPMNVDGGYFSDTGFINSAKVAIIVALGFGVLIAIVWIRELWIGTGVKIVLYLILIAIAQLIIRYYIFEEKYYYRMYNMMKQNRITDSDIFWSVASIKDTSEGAVIIYSDMKIGVIVKMERDTIVGRGEHFRETHFDAISDFYKSLNDKGYNFIQMNIMEQAGKDPRIAGLEDMVLKSDNANISMLMELQVGHIKNIARKTLYESDYYLIYTDKINKSDVIIEESIDCVYNLLNGAYISYRIIPIREVLELHKATYGIRYFDYNKATLRVYKTINIHVNKPFILKEVIFKDGKREEISQSKLNIINNLTSNINNINQQHLNEAIRRALGREDNKEGIGVAEKLKLSEDVNNNAGAPENERIRRGTEENNFKDIIPAIEEEIIDF